MTILRKQHRQHKEAEELLFDGATAHYERWKIKADADPEWAANNPVEIIVSKKSASELNVIVFARHDLKLSAVAKMAIAVAFIRKISGKQRDSEIHI